MKRIIMRWKQWYNLLDGYRDQGEWFVMWEGEDCGVMGSFLSTLGDLIRRDLYYGSYKGDDSPLVAVRERLLLLFPEHNAPSRNEMYLGAYVYQHAAELGLEIVPRHEYIGQAPVYPSQETLEKYLVDKDHPRPTHEDEVMGRNGPWKCSSTSALVYLNLATAAPGRINDDLCVVEREGRLVLELGLSWTELKGDGPCLTEITYHRQPLGHIEPDDIEEVYFIGRLAWRSPNYQPV